MSKAKTLAGTVSEGGVLATPGAVPASAVTGLADVATSGAYADLSGKPALAAVATSGAYSDLAGKPALAAVATSGAYADLSGKPALAAVATSGAYADLSGKPGTNDFLPSQAGNAGKTLTTDGTTASWTGGGGVTYASLLKFA